MSNTKDNFNVADLTAALNAGERANLVNVLKNKLHDLTGKHSNVPESLSPNVRKRVEALREIQTEHDELEANFFEERAALEAKYQKLYQPLYTKRFEIVNGVVEVDRQVSFIAARRTGRLHDQAASAAPVASSPVEHLVRNQTPSLLLHICVRRFQSSPKMRLNHLTCSSFGR
uniref:Nucleosome assembly protein 12-like n=1 Tax=Nicotiana tabacum TaxID=4097 RepID=A0A1S4DKH1_TOBAC